MPSNSGQFTTQSTTRAGNSIKLPPKHRTQTFTHLVAMSIHVPLRPPPTISPWPESSRSANCSRPTFGNSSGESQGVRPSSPTCPTESAFRIAATHLESSPNLTNSFGDARISVPSSLSVRSPPHPWRSVVGDARQRLPTADCACQPGPWRESISSARREACQTFRAAPRIGERTS